MKVFQMRVVPLREEAPLSATIMSRGANSFPTLQIFTLRPDYLKVKRITYETAQKTMLVMWIRVRKIEYYQFRG
jgi:hypothetical protein